MTLFIRTRNLVEEHPDAPLGAPPPKNQRRSVTFFSEGTLRTVNCLNGRLVDDTWPLCSITGKKMTFKMCRKCPSWRPYHSDYSPLSFVVINLYGLDERDRLRTEDDTVLATENHENVTEIASNPDGSQDSPFDDVSIKYGFLRNPNFRGFGVKGDVFGGLGE